MEPSRHIDGCDHLLEEVKEAIAPVLSGVEVLTDEDGDIPVTCEGGPTVYVRVHPESGAVGLFSILACLEEAPPNLLDEINVINLKLLYARVVWDGRAVVLQAELQACPLLPQALQTMLAMMVLAAGELVGELRLRYATNRSPLRAVARTAMPGERRRTDSAAAVGQYL